jgi:hypothetical protein
LLVELVRNLPSGLDRKIRRGCRRYCLDDVRHCREILSGGSSADARLRRFAEAGGMDAAGSLDAVLQWIAGASLEE